MSAILVVKPDDERFPAQGGVVVACVATLAEFRRYQDRDPSVRLWVGKCPVGTRVGPEGRDL